MPKLKRYNRGELVDFLKALASKTGRAPTYHDVERSRECPSVYTFKKEFGSWKEALAASGFEVRNEHRCYSREELLGAIHKYCKENGRIPTEKLMNQTKGCPSGSVYTRTFGSWKNALGEAGFDVEKIYSSPSMDKVKRYDNGILLGYLKEYEEKNGEIPRPITWFKLKDRPRREIYIRRFGSWKKALLAAGFDPQKVENLQL